MSCKTVSTREDIDFDKHLIELKSKRDRVFTKLVDANKILKFYNDEGIDMYSVLSEINSAKANYEGSIAKYNRQMLCSHSDIVFGKYDGRDSHKDYYVTECESCKLEFDDYDG